MFENELKKLPEKWQAATFAIMLLAVIMLVAWIVFGGKQMYVDSGTITSTTITLQGKCVNGAFYINGDASKTLRVGDYRHPEAVKCK